VSFREIWVDDWYRAAALQPVISLVLPHKPDIIYFLGNATLFSVDLRRRKVLGLTNEFVGM